MKDPAFLFYSSDFLSGTMLLSDEEVGQYIRLLCLQHQKGRLKEKDMLSICKAYNEDIFMKFKKDSDGNFYNERLEQEVIKRQRYTESRRNNLKKSHMDDHMETHMEIHMGDHMENVNINENINKNINKEVVVEEKKHFADFVSMTNAEYEKLVSTYGQAFANQCINVLDNYKGSSGKRYKSDYRAILNWVVEKVKGDTARATKQNNMNNYKQRDYNDFSNFYANKGG